GPFAYFNSGCQLVIVPIQITHLAFPDRFILGYHLALKYFLNVIADLFTLNFITKSLLNDLERHFSGTEAGHINLPAVFFIRFLKLRFQIFTLGRNNNFFIYRGNIVYSYFYNLLQKVFY